MSLEFDKSWMWHPDFTESRTDTAGLFVHFRRSLVVDGELPRSLRLHITADTRYKLFINNRQVAFGPVKGDSNLWFYDEVDIAPFLLQGENYVAVHVLRFFHGTTYAPSFPRLAFGALWISVCDAGQFWKEKLGSSTLWETAIDPFTVLRIDEPEDHFLHIYERTVASNGSILEWKQAKLLELKSVTGNSPPWHLSPRLIPQFRLQPAQACALHNVNSTFSAEIWESCLISDAKDRLCLPAGTQHSIELEVPYHMTAFFRVRFQRPQTSGGVLKVTYSESYEDEPVSTPWVRRKGDRCDYSKQLVGPQDIFEFGGKESERFLGYHENEEATEVFMPFHFRTFRYLKIDIDVGTSDLVLEAIEMDRVNYPLDIRARCEVSPNDSGTSQQWEKLWSTSIRTLENCMHDCYEDCPFYEQLQYAMDTRSSALFTYNLSGDDRMARQALTQIHNSFQAWIGLTASRAPTHRIQLIPHFSLYWVNMVNDHFVYFADRQFVRRFLPVVDSVLSYFDDLVGHLDLVMCDSRPGLWEFVDWTSQWRPFGIPPGVQRGGLSTYTNQLYAYTLSNAADLAAGLGRSGIADEYRNRAGSIIRGLRKHCFDVDRELYCDTLVSKAVDTDYSQHCQVWAVLSGCASGEDAQSLLRRSFQNTAIVKESISMSFHTLRALSLAGGQVYEEAFHSFWGPWQKQLAQNVTTWVEDHVSQRSDCHAWGSIPLYELMVEVAGIHPSVGWSRMEFRPRIHLFKEFKAKVPLKMQNGTCRDFAHVEWITTDDGDVEVCLQLELPSNGPLDVDIALPKYQVLAKKGDEKWKLLVKGSVAQQWLTRSQ